MERQFRSLRTDRKKLFLSLVEDTFKLLDVLLDGRKKKRQWPGYVSSMIMLAADLMQCGENQWWGVWSV